MADGGHDLAVRMSTEDQNIEDRLNYDLIFSHFKRLKVKISYAIEKTFPFLELLRDHKFITDKVFEDCQTSRLNLVPVSNVVYNVLAELEKNFNLEVLKILFSNINMKEYPALIPIRESFKSVFPDELYLQESDEEERQEGPSSQLSLEQGTGENSFPSLPGPHSDFSFSTGTTPPESGLLEHFCETEQANTRRNDTTGEKNGALGGQQANQQCAQQPEPAVSCGPVVNNGDARKETPGLLPCNEEREELSSHGHQMNSCFVPLVNIIKEIPLFDSEDEQQAQASTKHNQASDTIGCGAVASSHLPVTSNSWAQTIILPQDSQVARTAERKTAIPRALEGRSSRTGKRRGPRIPRDKNMNFQLPKLPVTCGKAKGTLYKELLKKGTSEKCIYSETGSLLTLREFEVEGGLEKSSNWKLSIRCGGYPLKELIKNGFLQNPPTSRKK
ncbi:nuclear autoantigen Sp-100-like isoform X1 [Microcebus murinus]|uniref:nuclear autoantigen Sp-100-like isoform X1 n=2 Tax=Microcebus murinus TaxID=30608 RepID=UPI003F6A6583